MLVKHILSNEIFFLFSNSIGVPFPSTGTIDPAALYNCRRYFGNDYSTVSFYGAELTPTELPS